MKNQPRATMIFYLESNGDNTIEQFGESSRDWVTSRFAGRFKDDRVDGYFVRLELWKEE